MSKKKIFDLEERTAVFGEDIIKLARSVKPDHVNKPALTQLVKCGTSVGANYCEAERRIKFQDLDFEINLMFEI